MSHSIATLLKPGAAGLALLCLLPIGSAASASNSKTVVHVGVESGDLRGSDNRALQAAIEFAASLGGGTVSIGPGRYLMRNALVLRSGVDVEGVPGETILAAQDEIVSRLAADGDCNERQITLENPAGFAVGDGISVQDDRKGGFEVTTATLTEQIDAHTFRISAPLYLDYMVSDKASARQAFPIVGGWNITNVALRGLTAEGNRDHSQPLNGCRGGGIYLFECADVTIQNCTVRHYNGDGISFQVSQRVTVENCLSEENAGLGLHPGSGSQHPIVRRNRSIGNGGDGLYVCWRVKHGLFEGNEVRDNHGAGVSIGHKDTDNLFRNNTIRANGQAGVLFRQESEAMGAHRNIFESNVILDNGTEPGQSSRLAPIVIRGEHHDLQFRDNLIGYTRATGSEAEAIDAKPGVEHLQLQANKFENVRSPAVPAP